MTPSSSAHCDQLRAVTAGVDDTGSRIDFSVAGKLELVHSDGALIYLGVCGPPHPRVLCITYQDNGMKPGDVVVATGGYRRPDAEHILLDPCLAARRE